MKVIMTLEKNIHCEYEDAKKYIKLALEHKDLGDTELAKMFYDLAEGEIKDAEKMHDMAVKIINKVKAEQGTPPAGMMDFYTLIHERDIEDAKEVEMLMDRY